MSGKFAAERPQIAAPTRLLYNTRARARAQAKPVPVPELFDLTPFSGTGTNHGRNL